MTDKAWLDAEAQTRLFIQSLKNVVGAVAGNGLVVVADRSTLGWAREAFFAVRSSHEDVTERHKEHNDTAPRVLTPDEWRAHLRALNALGSLLSTFDQQIPGGIPEEGSEGPTIMVDRSRIVALRDAMASSAETRQEVYERTTHSFATHHPVTGEELYAYERPLGILREFLKDVDPQDG